LREAYAMGADRAILLTDRKFAGADTLATSRALAGALKQLEYDLIITGRQAIDGDTAQVGPQVAEKLGIPQVTYAEDIMSVSANDVKIKRRLERGIEIVSSSKPVLVTVHSSAPDCRSRNSKLTMKYKHAKTVSELQASNQDYESIQKEKPYLLIDEWSVANLDAEPMKLGLNGSPTKVKAIQNVVLTAKDTVALTSSDTDIDGLMKELIDNHTIG